MNIDWSDIDGVSQWIKKYIEGAGKEKAIVGLSGGIDSAVTAALCRESMQGNGVVAVLMPCQENGSEEEAEEDFEDGTEVAETLGIPLVEELSIYGPAILMFRDVFRGRETDPKAKIAYGNIKARLRMTTLYAVAERENGIVVGTTNKTEAVLGYYTKYGDGGVDIEPLIEYYKCEVREMAKELDIPKHIVTKAPSAGLWAGQTDEGELGMTYDEIDAYLQYATTSPASDEEIEAWKSIFKSAGRMREVGEKIRKLREASLHKTIIPHYKRR